MIRGFLLAVIFVTQTGVGLAETGQGQAEDELLHDGMRLSKPWPAEIRHFGREPMAVPYLANPPEVIRIDTGRQLFVDDFLIDETTLKRTSHAATP